MRSDAISTARVIAKSHFRNGGRRLLGAANRQVCPTISEMTFGNQLD
jgi:hypothetical protein